MYLYIYIFARANSWKLFFIGHKLDGENGSDLVPFVLLTRYMGDGISFTEKRKSMPRILHSENGFVY